MTERHPRRVTHGDPADDHSPSPFDAHDESPDDESPEPGHAACGPVETKVRGDIGALVTVHPMGEALAEMAYTLARTLDDGAGLAVAAVNRELRANLVELARMAVNDDEDFDAQLSTPQPPEDL